MATRHRGTVVIETHGCKLNQAQSQCLAAQFTQQGYTVVQPDQPADVYLLNTCTVTSMADRKARQALHRARRQYPRALVVAAGCYAQRAPQALAKLSDIDLVVGNFQKNTLVEQALGLRGTPPVACSPGESVSWPRLLGKTRAFVAIQEGCNQVCAYCIVPKVRGRERSVSLNALATEVRRRVEEGYQEVVLTGTQLGSYGFDLPDANLVSLVAAILRETEVPRLRVSSLQPQEVTLELLRLWQQDPRLCPHFHMPLQSGSDGTLRRMRRRYTAAQYLQAVERVRAAVPHAAVTTDVIVGFPGESEEEFKATLELSGAIGFAAMHVFSYSARPGTSAASFSEQVPLVVKQERGRQLRQLARELAAAFRRSCLGQVRQVLWEEVKVVGGHTVWTGLTDTYLRVATASCLTLGNCITPAEITAVEGETVWARAVG